jgi:DNA helicase HerA-like ATPase
MSKSLYLGKQVSAGKESLGARVELDPADLLTHGLIVGMTGSGKTDVKILRYDLVWVY